MEANDPKNSPLLDLKSLAASTPLAPLPEKDLPRYTGLPASFWRKLRHVGGGPVYRKFGPRLIRYYAGELDKWMESRPKYENTHQDQSPAARAVSSRMAANGRKGGRTPRSKAGKRTTRGNQ